MKQEIFAKGLVNDLSVHIYRSSSDDITFWEVAIAQRNKTSSRFFSVHNKELIAQAAKGRQEKFMGRLVVYNAFLDLNALALILVVDKFGQVDVLRYPLNADNSFKTQTPEILPLRSYELVPRDVELLGEQIEDIALLQHKLIALSGSSYRYYDSYFINILDLDKKAAIEYRVSTTELMNASPRIQDDHIQQLTGFPFNNSDLMKVLDAVKQKSSYAGAKLRFKFSLLSSSFQECFTKKTKLRGSALFFVDIDNAPMIMFYTNLNEWYISSENKLKHESDLSFPVNSNINKLFTYR